MEREGKDAFGSIVRGGWGEDEIRNMRLTLLVRNKKGTFVDLLGDRGDLGTLSGLIIFRIKGVCVPLL